MPECEECSADVDMPFSCRRCGKQLCPRCRLPENHACGGQAVDVDLEKGATTRRPAGKLSSDQRSGGSANPLRDEQSRVTRGLIKTVSYIAVPFILLYRVLLGGLGLLGGAWKPIAAIGLVIGAVYVGPAVGFYDSPLQGDNSPSTSGVDSLDQDLIEQKIHERVNEVREQRGEHQLSRSDQLAEVAQYHSDHMASNDYFAHTSPDGETLQDRYDRFGVDCRALTGTQHSGGENLAQTYAFAEVSTEDGPERYSNETEIANSVVEQWMNSPGHRKNLLSDSFYTEGIGVSLEQTEDGVRVLVTQNFC